MSIILDDPMITYEQMNAMCERWRTGIPKIETEEERRIIWLALAAGKAQLKQYEEQRNEVTNPKN